MSSEDSEDDDVQWKNNEEINKEYQMSLFRGPKFSFNPSGISYDLMRDFGIFLDIFNEEWMKYDLSNRYYFNIGRLNIVKRSNLWVQYLKNQYKRFHFDYDIIYSKSGHYILFGKSMRDYAFFFISSHDEHKRTQLKLYNHFEGNFQEYIDEKVDHVQKFPDTFPFELYQSILYCCTNLSLPVEYSPPDSDEDISLDFIMNQYINNKVSDYFYFIQMEYSKLSLKELMNAFDKSKGKGLDISNQVTQIGKIIQTLKSFDELVDELYNFDDKDEIKNNKIVFSLNFVKKLIRLEIEGQKFFDQLDDDGEKVLTEASAPLSRINYKDLYSC